MAEEFGIAPSEAKRELDRDAELVFEIMKLRAYARAKHAYETATVEEQQKLVSESPMVALVQELEFAQAGERLKQWREKRQSEP